MAGSSEKVTEYTRGTSFAELVEVREVAKSLRQLEADQSLAGDTLQTLKIPFESGINVFENQVELYVLDAAQLSSALRVLPGVSIPDSVEIIEVPSFSSDEVNAYAGHSLSSCTAGYSIRNASGVKGLTTSGHCGDSQSFGSLAIPLTFRAEFWFYSFDFQWHTSPELTIQPWARNGPNASTAPYREIYDTANRPDQPLEAFVCKYGKTTRHTCGYIKDKNVNPGGRNNVSTFIRVSRGTADISDSGDSGGPWYVDHQAYGLHKAGYNSGPFAGNALYMAINYVANRGFTVLTAPR